MKVNIMTIYGLCLDRYDAIEQTMYASYDWDFYLTLDFCLQYNCSEVSLHGTGLVESCFET